MVARNPGSMLYAFWDDLARAPVVPLYAPAAMPATGQVGNVLLRRDEVGEFDSGPVAVIDGGDGARYVTARSAPGNQTTYTYMLLQEVGAVDRHSWGYAVRDGDRPLVGLTQWDRYEVDPAPGLFYAAVHGATESRNGKPKNTALLLGPFEHHIEALMNVQCAKSEGLSRYDALTRQLMSSFGTVRLDVPVEQAPRGKLNAELLSEQQLLALPGASLVARPEVASAPRSEENTAPAL